MTKAQNSNSNFDRRPSGRVESTRASSIASVVGPQRDDSTQNPGARNRGTKSLSRSEWEDRRRKGLCFKCGKQFGPSHKCSEANFRVILLADDEETEEDGEHNMLDLSEVDKSLNEGNFDTGECSIIEFMGADATSKSRLNTRSN